MRTRIFLVGALVVVVGTTLVPVGGTIDIGAGGSNGVVVAAADSGPLVDAGLDQTVEQNTIVLLDGEGTRAPDGEIVSYEWRITAPNGTEFAPEEPTDPLTRFRATTPGRYEVTLYATDDDGVTGSDTLYVTVEANEPPQIAIHGPDRVLAGQAVTHTAVATSPDGEIEQIEWDNGDRGNRSTRRFSPSRGLVTIRATATDDDGLTATAVKDIAVRRPNQDPTARIQGPETVMQGSTATFRVDANDPDGEIEQIEWDNGGAGPTTTRTFEESGGTEVTLRATVTDDRGGSTTATHTVEVVEPAPAASAGPTIDVEGPREVRPQSRHQYLARTSHPDGDSVSVRWFGEDFVDRGHTHDHQFRKPAGSTVQFTAVATDSTGATASETVSVRIVSVPEVSITGLPNECIRAGEQLTLTAETARADPNVDYEWRIRGDVVGQEETLTHTFTHDGTTEVTLVATNEDGYTGTATESVCVDAQNEPPEIQSLSAVWFASTHEDPGVPPVEHDAFDSRVDSRFPLVEFSAAATDPDGEELTYHWDFGDGATGVTSATDSEETTIAHDYSPEHGRERDATEFTVTLVVEDEHGARTTATRTVSVRKIFGGAGEYALSADKQEVRVGEEVTFTVRNEMTAGRHVEGEIVYGNGFDEKVNLQTETGQKTTSYQQPGEYTIQFWSGNERTGHVGLDDQIEITVVDDSYTVYTYGVEERITRIAPTSPGEDWIQESIDHVERTLEETRTRTAVANSQEARQLERDGYTAIGEHTERVKVDTETKLATEFPGDEWTLDERNVDTVQRQDGWDYETFSSPQYGSEWSHIKTVRTSREIRQTTTSTSRPWGSGWSRDTAVGHTQTGWNYGWVSSRWMAPTGSDIIDTRRILVDVETRIVCVNREYYQDFLGNWRSRCVMTDRKVVDRTYSTRYKYRAPEYSTVWRWERTETVYEKEYHYRKPTYETVNRHRYQKPVYEQRSYVNYQKEIYITEPHYKWTSTGVTEHRGLEYPTEENVVWVESESYDCPDEGPLAEQACS